MTSFFKNGPLREHHDYPNGIDLTGYSLNCCVWQPVYFKGDEEKKCVDLLTDKNGDRTLHTSYYVGTDWLEKGSLAIYVEPKLNNAQYQTDYFKMLFTGLANVKTTDDISDLFEIKFDEQFITISKQRDLLTPLLVLQFLALVKAIVKKGLKKSYYTITENLSGRVKGKIMTAANIKQNGIKNNALHVVCTYNEFGINAIENKILKKAILFSTRYLETMKFSEHSSDYQRLINYIRPAFEKVSENVDMNEIKSAKYSPFFNEYKEGLRLAQLILKRFGYNINAIESVTEDVKVPPFWIDMSKLFELYVLSLLRKQPFGVYIKFQPHGYYGNPDFLLCSAGNKAIMDAKYKPRYLQKYEPDDIRQLSGYARDLEVLKMLGIPVANFGTAIPDCIVIYPDQENEEESSLTLEYLKKNGIEGFNLFYKASIRLPLIFS